MNNVSLKQQLTFHTKEVDRLIKELPPNDPVKDWFFVELDALTTEELAETLSLDEGKIPDCAVYNNYSTWC